MAQYRKLHELARGGQGTTHLAVDPAGTEVVLKEPHRHQWHDASVRRHFEREALILQRLCGLYVPTYLGHDLECAEPWLAMRYYPWPTLSREVEQRGPLQEGQVVTFARQFATALSVFEEQGVLHLDLQPHNILIGLTEICIIDYGASKLAGLNGQIIDNTTVLATPGYVAPERDRRGEVTIAADVFSMAATLVFALTGDRNGTAGGELGHLLSRCLSHDPAQRPTPADLQASLAAMPIQQVGLRREAPLKVTKPLTFPLLATRPEPRRFLVTAAVSRCAGHADVYAADASGAIELSWRWDDGRWATTGSLAPSLGDVRALAASSAESSHQEVFVLTSSGLAHFWYHDGVGWSAPVNMALPSLRGLAISSHSAETGHQELVYADGEGQVFHRWRTDHGRWSSWQQLGKRIDEGVLALTSTSATRSHQEVFVLTATSEVRHAWWSPQDGWSSWHHMQAPSAIATVVTFSSASGQQHLLVTNRHGDQFGRSRQGESGWSEGWQTSVGTPGPMDALTATVDERRGPLLVGVRPDGGVAHSWFRDNGNSQSWTNGPVD